MKKSIYEAKDELEKMLKNKMGIHAVCIGLDNTIVVIGRPPALLGVPNYFHGYRVKKIRKVLPPKDLKKVPRIALKMAEKISKATQIPMEQVLSSRAIGEYIKKIKKEDLIL
ncbi:MAG: hypothetical protein J7K33_09880 [Candidatus Marinimicrobia bacterium]|nr:hypothetical protein [Candidatus Neomarinimicrobiota bacterium]